MLDKQTWQKEKVEEKHQIKLNKLINGEKIIRPNITTTNIINNSDVIL